jgi:hypothetical protein
MLANFQVYRGNFDVDTMYITRFWALFSTVRCFVAVELKKITLWTRRKRKFVIILPFTGVCWSVARVLQIARRVVLVRRSKRYLRLHHPLL